LKHGSYKEDTESEGGRNIIAAGTETDSRVAVVSATDGKV
jgi:hypothetical protein